MSVDHRTRYLVLLGVTFLIYGLGIVIGYRPTFTRIGGLSVYQVGWIFTGSGIFMFTGIFFRNRSGSDRVYFALAALITTSWSMMLSLLWTRPVGWAAAVSWMCISAGCILAASWPNPPSLKENVNAGSVRDVTDD